MLSPYRLSGTYPAYGCQEGTPLAIDTPRHAALRCVVRAALDSGPWIHRVTPAVSSLFEVRTTSISDFVSHLDDVVEIFDLANDDLNFPAVIDVVDRRLVVAPLLSIVTFSGAPFSRMALSKKRLAAALSRLAVNRKSTVLPLLSIARYRYFQTPLTLM